MSLKYGPFSKPIHKYAKQFVLNRELNSTVTGNRRVTVAVAEGLVHPPVSRFTAQGAGAHRNTFGPNRPTLFGSQSDWGGLFLMSKVPLCGVGAHKNTLAPNRRTQPPSQSDGPLTGLSPEAGDSPPSSPTSRSG